MPHLPKVEWQVAEAAEPPQAVAAPWTPERAEAQAHQAAREAGLSTTMEHRFVETLRGESMGYTVNGQSYVVNRNGPNGYEDSWGYCQINLSAHTDVSKVDALDPPTCMAWSAKQFKEGNAHLWTQYRLQFGDR